MSNSATAKMNLFFFGGREGNHSIKVTPRHFLSLSLSLSFPPFFFSLSVNCSFYNKWHVKPYFIGIVSCSCHPGAFNKMDSICMCPLPLTIADAVT